jgi:predicted acyltransferase
MMPLNKKIYSASFTFLTSCTGGATIIFFMLLIDVRPYGNHLLKKWLDILTAPLIWLGRNPLFVFVFMEFIASLLDEYIKINGESLSKFLLRVCFQSWIGDDQVSATIFAGVFLVIYTLLAGILFKKNIFIRL